MAFLASTTTVLPTATFLDALTVGVVVAPTATAVVAVRAASTAAVVCMRFMPSRTPGRGRAFPAAWHPAQRASRQQSARTTSRTSAARRERRAAGLVRGAPPRPAVARDRGPLRDPRLGGDAPADAGRARDCAVRGVAGALAGRAPACGGN